MDAIEVLVRTVDCGRWDETAGALDDAFFRVLAVDAGLIRRVFAAAPAAFFDAHPRLSLHRATVDALDAGRVVDRRVLADFDAWARAQPEPALRDQLLVRAARARAATARGWLADAVALADDARELARSAPARDEGLHDLMPAVLIDCGVPRLLSGDLVGAAASFADAQRWAEGFDGSAAGHPFGEFARGHLALVHALQERYRAAEALLAVDAGAPGTADPLRRRYGPAGLLARSLSAAASLDIVEAERLLDGLDPSIVDGELGWVAAHVRTKLALARAVPWSMIHDLATRLDRDAHRLSAGTLAGSVLRADLAGLHQSTGEPRAAEQLLADPELLSDAGPVVVARARQALLCGRPEAALRVLRDDSAGARLPARHRPSGSVVCAAAELAASGSIDDAALQRAATAVRHHGAYDALAHASSELRPLLWPLVTELRHEVPAPWAYRSRVRLTPREREMIAALRTCPTIGAVARTLHLSPNTVKTHVRSLYRKLGAHTRDEALWLARR